jgi:steroid delta-isomerase-like uncharacterized protein
MLSPAMEQTCDSGNAGAAMVARRFYGLINDGHIDEAVELALPTFVGHGPGGRDGLRAELQTWAAAFPDLEIRIDDTIAEGDRAALRMRLRGTHTGTFAGIPASGRQFEVRSTDVVRIADGRIAEAWPLYDLAGLLVQVGALANKMGGRRRSQRREDR